MDRFPGEGYFKEAVCPGSMAGSLRRTIHLWGKTSPYAVGLACPTWTGGDCTGCSRLGGAQVLAAFLGRRGQQGWDIIMLLGINSPATAAKATLDPTRGLFNRLPSSGRGGSGWKLGGLSTGIVQSCLPSLTRFPSLYPTDHRLGEDGLGGQAWMIAWSDSCQTRPKL